MKLSSFLQIKKIDVLAFIVALLGVALWIRWSEVVDTYTPGTEWFEVQALSVPDFKQGDDPTIVYTRVIKRDFIGEWVAEVHVYDFQGDRTLFCSGTGASDYHHGDRLPDSVTLSWFVGKQCDYRPGQYSIEVVWEFRSGSVTKQVRAQSNVFKVLPG